MSDHYCCHRCGLRYDRCTCPPRLPSQREHERAKVKKKPEPFQQPIKGYRQLTQVEVDLMNEGKELAEQVGAWIDKLRTMNGVSNTNQENPALDQRWVNIGATQLQQGFMAVIRGIAQPTTF